MRHVNRPPSAPQPKPRRGPRPLLGENPRDRIHDATLACYENKGVESTSMDDVANELGVSRPTLYYYFQNKNELLLEVVSRQAGAILADLPHQLTKVGLERIAEAAFLGLTASLDNSYVRLVIDGPAAALTGSILSSPKIIELQRSFWTPLLVHARDHHRLRTDQSIDELMNFIIFIQFSLATAGTALEMSRADMHDRLYTYLIPALRG